MPRAVPPPPRMSGARHFSADELAQVIALFDAIWPGGDGRPGASEAGAAHYADQLLALPPAIYYEIPRWIGGYKTGLPFLDQAAQARFTSKLEDLSRDQVTALLADLASGIAIGSLAAPDQKAFFSVLRSHCIEGCVADPRWGGNRDKIIWNWLGYPVGDAAGSPAVLGAPA